MGLALRSLHYASSASATPRLVVLATEAANGDSPVNGVCLDACLADALARRLQPVVVLGQSGDELLRTSPLLSRCELVFDPDAHLGPLASLRAGLEITSEKAFFRNLQPWAIPGCFWQVLSDETLASCYHLITSASQINLWYEGFGHVTRAGLELLLNADDSELRALAEAKLSMKICTAAFA